MAKRWGMEGLGMSALALLVVLGCGDGVVGGGGGGGDDTGTAADLISGEDTPSPEDTLVDTNPMDTLPDAGPVEDVLDLDFGPEGPPTDTAPGPDTEDPGCWSCTTEDPACLCGCVACHTNKSLLEELAPPEPVEEEEGGGG